MDVALFTGRAPRVRAPLTQQSDDNQRSSNLLRFVLRPRRPRAHVGLAAAVHLGWVRADVACDPVSNRAMASKLVEPASLFSWSKTPSPLADEVEENIDDLDPLAAMGKKEVRFPTRHDLNQKIILWCVPALGVGRSSVFLFPTRNERRPAASLLGVSLACATMCSAGEAHGTRPPPLRVSPVKASLWTQNLARLLAHLHSPARHGNLVDLNVEAMVNPTNERLNDASGISAAILSRAGPSVAEDLVTLESCRTGDAVISQGHLLQSKCVCLGGRACETLTGVHCTRWLVGGWLTC